MKQLNPYFYCGTRRPRGLRGKGADATANMSAIPMRRSRTKYVWTVKWILIYTVNELISIKYYIRLICSIVIHVLESIP